MLQLGILHVDFGIPQNKHLIEILSHAPTAQLETLMVLTGKYRKSMQIHEKYGGLPIIAGKIIELHG